VNRVHSRPDHFNLIDSSGFLFVMNSECVKQENDYLDSRYWFWYLSKYYKLTNLLRSSQTCRDTGSRVWNGLSCVFCSPSCLVLSWNIIANSAYVPAGKWDATMYDRHARQRGYYSPVALWDYGYSKSKKQIGKLTESYYKMVLFWRTHDILKTFSFSLSCILLLLLSIVLTKMQN